MRKRIIILIVLFGIKTSGSSQEIILSQPFSASQYQNPSSAGGGAYDQRFQSNYKNQLIDGNTDLFRSFLFSYDTRLKYDLEESYNYFGIGIQYIDDEVMQGALKNNYLTLNGAYHIFLDRDLYSHLSLGIGLTYAFTNIDRTKLRFGDQYDYRGILSYPTLENLQSYPNNVTTNAGVMYTKHDESKFIQAGFMTYLYDKPNLTYSPFNKAEGLRFRAFVNSELPMYNNNSFLVYLNYLNRPSQSQYIVGGLFGLSVRNEEYDYNKLYVGCLYRLNEAFIPTVAYIRNRNTYGFSYDVFASNLTASNLKMSSFEFTLSRRFGEKRKENRYRTLFD